MKELTARQVGILLFIIEFSTKILTLPSLFSADVHQSLWMSQAILFAFQVVTTVVFVEFIKKHPNVKFNNLLENSLGKPLSKFIIFVYVIYFFTKAILLNIEGQNFVTDSLYDRLYLDYFLVAILMVVGYVGFKGLRVMGRTAELFLYVIIIGITIAYFSGFGAADFSNLMPLNEYGVTQVFKSAFNHFMWCGNSIIFITFLGHVKPDKNIRKKIYGFWFAGAAFVITFMMLFYSVFGTMSLSLKQAIADLGKYSKGLATLGRLDWFTAVIVVLALFLAFSMFIFCCYRCITWLFNIKKENALVFILVCVAVYFVSVINTLDINTLTNILKHPIFKFMALFQYVIPVLIPVLYKVYKPKNQYKYNKIIFKPRGKRNNV